MSLYVWLLTFGVFLSSVAQILLKKSADKKHPNQIKEYFNRLVIIGYILYSSYAFLTIVALKEVSLSTVSVISSLSYIFVLILSVIFLEEKITKNKLIGLFFVMLGIFIFNL